MTISAESGVLKQRFTELSTRFAENPEMGLEAMREMFRTLERESAEPKNVTYEDVRVGDRNALWVRPVAARADHVVLYTHGGGYIAFEAATDRKIAGHLAVASEALALVPDYRLAPEAPFPAAIDDSVAAYRFLLASGFSADRIAFAGESAGGNLAAATIVRARELGLPLPSSYVGFSPWFDLLGERPSFDSSTDAFLIRPVSQLMARMYLGDADAHTPLTNPLFPDLRGFPPAYVTAGADESLVDAVTAFAGEILKTGGEAELHVAEGQQHAFQWMAGRAPEADASIAAAGAWIRRHFIG